MKKVLKNTSLFIITLMLIFGFKNSVNAASDACEGYDSDHCRITAQRGVIISAGGNISQLRNGTTQTYKAQTSVHGRYTPSGNKTNYYGDVGVVHIYNGNKLVNSYFQAYDDTKISSALYCLDAQYDGVNPLYASRFLMNSTSAIRTKAFDVAIVSILVDNGILSTPNSSNIGDYLSRLFALRAVTYTFNLYNTAGAEYKSAFYANLTLTNDWNNENSSYYDNLNKALAAHGQTSLASRSTFSTHTDSYFQTITGNVLSNAKIYYYNALVKATEYLNNLGSSQKVDSTSVLPEPLGEAKKDQLDNGVFVQKDVVHTVLLSNFSENDTFIIGKGTTGTGISFEENVQYEGLTSYISSIEIENGPILTNRNEIESILDQNLVELGYIKPNSDVTVKITVHFEGYESSTDDSIETLKCGQSPIKYFIGGNSTSSEYGEYGNYVATIWYSGESQAQRYVGVEPIKENTGTPWTSEYETYLIDACDCDDLINACVESGDINSEECQELFEADCFPRAQRYLSVRLGIYYSISSLILRVDDLMISSGTVVNDCIFKLGLRIFFIRISAACCPSLLTLISTTVNGGSINCDSG